MSATIQAAVAALGTGPLQESSLCQHIHPLFSQVLARDEQEIYLANHSLGRPLDQTQQDIAEGCRLWFSDLDEAWGPWWAQMQAWRANTATLVGAPRPDCIIPKASAGQGLRAVLNRYDKAPRVLSTCAEFDSIDIILKQYAAKQKATVTWVASRADGCIHHEDLVAQLDGIDLVVVSQVFFASGQVLQGLPQLITAAHQAGARVLVDVYHGYGVLPLDLNQLGVDYAIAGSYKYLRGGPGACWLYIAPHCLSDAESTLDTGWFGKKDPFSYARPNPPQFGQGGDAWLESTFSALPFYQARAGLALTQALGVERLRAYSLAQKMLLSDLLSEHDIPHFGAGNDYAAYLTLPHANPNALVDALKAQGLNGDARSQGLRLCPDILTSRSQLQSAAQIIAATYPKVIT